MYFPTVTPFFFQVYRIKTLNGQMSFSFTNTIFTNGSDNVVIYRGINSYHTFVNHNTKNVNRESRFQYDQYHIIIKSFVVLISLLDA